MVHPKRRREGPGTSDNDESNAPMLAVNGKLGYRPVATRLGFSRRARTD